MDFRDPHILALIDLAIAEDIGDGDHSSLASIPAETRGSSRIIYKESGIIAGLELAKVIVEKVDHSIQLTALKKDGDLVEKGTIVAELNGPARSLLAVERLVLNFMQRLSGIATQTHFVVEMLKGYKTRVLDTRKTTPGMRILEKWAVLTGGGENHRMGLYDMIMLKDNHIDSAGGITKALNNTREYLNQLNKSIKIEVETRNLDEVREVLTTGLADRIMLDNFSPAECKVAVDIIAGKAETEASGGINTGNILAYAESGVDYISLGYLTHTVKSIDISMKTHLESDSTAKSLA